MFFYLFLLRHAHYNNELLYSGKYIRPFNEFLNNFPPQTNLEKKKVIFENSRSRFEKWCEHLGNYEYCLSIFLSVRKGEKIKWQEEEKREINDKEDLLLGKSKSSNFLMTLTFINFDWKQLRVDSNVLPFLRDHYVPSPQN